MFRTTFVAVALAAAFPACADDDLAALRAEIAALKQQYESRIAALETRLQNAAAAPAPATPIPADTAAVATPPAEAAPVAAGGFNPDLSLILNGSYTRLDADAPRPVAGYLSNGPLAEPTRGFSLDESELVLTASVDPDFRGALYLILGDGEVATEEAWFQTTGLAPGLTLKGGRFRSGLGYQNEQHPHAWDFATNNLMYETLFGEGYGNDGLQLKWVAPTELFLELGAEIGRGAAFPGTDRNRNGVGGWSLYGHLGGDLGDSHSWRAWLGYLSTRALERESGLLDLADAPAQAFFSGDSATWIADFVWKWAPDGNPVERNFKFAAEAFRRAEDGTLACVDNTGAGGVCTGLADAYASRQWGGYAQAVYQFMPRWRAGYRYDRLAAGSVDYGLNAAYLPAATATPRRDSLMLDYSPSEFSRLRLQFSHDDAYNGAADRRWTLQYSMSLGSHGAHKF